MLRLRRLLLDSIGTTSARFSGVMLDFTDPAGSPLDSILWSRNGAGKTSVLALFFSLLLPNQRDFLGARLDGRALADYVLPATPPTWWPNGRPHGARWSPVPSTSGPTGDDPATMPSSRAS